MCPRPVPVLVLLACALAPESALLAQPVSRAQLVGNDRGTPGALEPARGVPPALSPWIPWVLRGAERLRCPRLPTGDAQPRAEDEKAAVTENDPSRLCAWPGELRLELGPAGGRFTQSWEVIAESDVPLPGDHERRPIDVRAGARAVAVLENAGAPSVRLPPGRHQVSGAFSWRKLPETLTVPAITGLVSLRLGGRAMPWPRRDEAGTLFLSPSVGGGDAAPSPNESDALEIDVQRKLTDDVPALLTTRLTLRVSGKPREVLLGRSLPAGFVPHAVDSPLAVRLEAEGRMRVQVRPGSWVLTLQARHSTALAEIARPASEGGEWKQGPELWVFEARPQLRVATVEGVPPINAAQSALPEEWRSLPAYLVAVGARLRLVQSRRGDAEPAADQLSLRRQLWLDFDGGGYTARDHITGTLSRSWRLEAGPDLALGRVTLGADAEGDQFITQLAPGGAAGVEVRQSALDLTADSRLRAGRGDLPAVGWQQDFQSVSTTLSIPPGWRLMHAAGADTVDTTWLRRWTLLDLFLVTVVVMATGRLFGRVPALLALLTLVLVVQEREAPAWVWLAVLLGEALVRALPAGRLRKLAKLYRLGAAVCLVVIALPFAVNQARVALHPALEGPQQQSSVPTRHLAGRFPRAAMEPNANSAAPSMAPAPEAERLDEEDQSAAKAGGQLRDRSGLAEAVSGMSALAGLRAADERPVAVKRQRLDTLDPDARIQTGPGIPTWTWRQAQLGWSGPVERGARLTLWLAPPWLVSLLGLAGAALVVVLSLLLLRRALTLFGRWLPGTAAFLLLVSLLGLLPGLGGPGRAYAQQPSSGAFPPREMLDELRKRLLETPPCAPSCASFGRLALEGTPAELRLRLEVNAAADSVVDLPGLAGHWSPASVLIDGQPASVRRDEGGRLWLLVGPGAHQVVLQGPLPDRPGIQIPFGRLRPHAVSASLRGLSLGGLADDGAVGESLELTRTGTVAQPAGEQRSGSSESTAGSLPAFVMVERRLELGHTTEWRVHTRVVRLTPAGAGVVLEIPVLAGEAVLSPEVKVAAGKVQLNMGPDEGERSWSSALAQQPAIHLKAAAATAGYAERWLLDVAPTWHTELSGIPPEHPETPGAGGRRTANLGRVRAFRPWPGETLSIAVTRPSGAPGNTFTIDASHLSLTPGARSSAAQLSLLLRSSRGAVHTLLLPEGATLESFKIDGLSQPAVLQGRRLSVPVTPGSQKVEIAFQDRSGMRTLLRTPEIDLAAPSVNASLEVNLPQQGSDRWVLLVGGPRLGPAVLVWGVMLVLVLVAAFLGRSPLTPLSTRQWVLLAIGLAPLSLGAAATITGYLFALGWRRDRLRTSSPYLHNLAQLLLVLWTVLAVSALFAVVQQGLLSRPDMDIVGNGSSATQLLWSSDRASGPLPRAWVLSLPLLVYHLAMLAWALWLAVAVMRWSMWAWSCFTEGGLWRPLRNPLAAAPVVTAPATAPDDER